MLMMEQQLSSLPHELKNRIASLLTAHDAIQLAKTSKAFEFRLTEIDSHNYQDFRVSIRDIHRWMMAGFTNAKHRHRPFRITPLLHERIHSVRINVAQSGPGRFWITGHSLQTAEPVFDEGRLVFESENATTNEHRAVHVDFVPKQGETYHFWFRGNGPTQQVRFSRIKASTIIFDDKEGNYSNIFQKICLDGTYPTRTTDHLNRRLLLATAKQLLKHIENGNDLTNHELVVPLQQHGIPTNVTALTALQEILLELDTLVNLPDTTVAPEMPRRGFMDNLPFFGLRRNQEGENNNDDNENPWRIGVNVAGRREGAGDGRGLDRPIRIDLDDDPDDIDFQPLGLHIFMNRDRQPRPPRRAGQEDGAPEARPPRPDMREFARIENERLLRMQALIDQRANNRAERTRARYQRIRERIDQQRQRLNEIAEGRHAPANPARFQADLEQQRQRLERIIGRERGEPAREPARAPDADAARMRVPARIGPARIGVPRPPARRQGAAEPWAARNFRRHMPNFGIPAMAAALARDHDRIRADAQGPVEADEDRVNEFRRFSARIRAQRRNERQEQEVDRDDADREEDDPPAILPRRRRRNEREEHEADQDSEDEPQLIRVGHVEADSDDDDDHNPDLLLLDGFGMLAGRQAQDRAEPRGGQPDRQPHEVFPQPGFFRFGPVRRRSLRGQQGPALQRQDDNRPAGDVANEEQPPARGLRRSPRTSRRSARNSNNP